MSTIIDLNTLSNIIVQIVNSGLSGALGGVEASLEAIFAFFGEEFEADLIYQINQITLDFDIRLDDLLVSIKELQINFDIILKNIDIEFENLFRNISVPSLKAINPPSRNILTEIGLPKPFGPIPSIFGVSGLGILIIGFFSILSIFVLIDANNIAKKKNNYLKENTF